MCSCARRTCSACVPALTPRALVPRAPHQPPPEPRRRAGLSRGLRQHCLASGESRTFHHLPPPSTRHPPSTTFHPPPSTASPLVSHAPRLPRPTRHGAVHTHRSHPPSTGRHAGMWSSSPRGCATLPSAPSSCLPPSTLGWFSTTSILSVRRARLALPMRAAPSVICMVRALGVNSGCEPCFSSVICVVRALHVSSQARPCAVV